MANTRSPLSSSFTSALTAAAVLSSALDPDWASVPVLGAAVPSPSSGAQPYREPAASAAHMVNASNFFLMINTSLSCFSLILSIFYQYEGYISMKNGWIS